MAFGGCWATTIVSKRLIHCNCTSGLFDVLIDSSISPSSTICKRCGHDLSRRDNLPLEELNSAGKLLWAQIPIVDNLFTHHLGARKSSLLQNPRPFDLQPRSHRGQNYGTNYNVARSFTQKVYQLVEKPHWESCYKALYREKNQRQSFTKSHGLASLTRNIQSSSVMFCFCYVTAALEF